MIWDMETKKAWDPLTYIPYVVSQARSWGRTTLRDGSVRFFRSSMQRGWINVRGKDASAKYREVFKIRSSTAILAPDPRANSKGWGQI